MLQNADRLPQGASARVDRRRYGRITRFFARVILHVILWDLLMGRVFFLRERVQLNRPQRYRSLSRRFRVLAAEMGGVMIKLGQFLSTRVDILPAEITDELRGLQDEVPPVALEAVQAVMRQELGDPAQIFAYLEPEPLAAASLGQTHRARLRDADGRPGPAVVVKVQRPQIEALVVTDLAALRVVARWMMRYRPIRLRANLPALMEEFAVTLWEELDYRAELDNANRFAAMFRHYSGLVAPRFYERHCTGRVLVLENVEAPKITDVERLRESGVDTRQVAERLLDAYYIQIFEESFFHADPHPGNIFVRPRPDRPHAADAPTPFDLIFIDFGMMGRIPERTRELLQTVLVSVTTRDTARYIAAIEELGFFLPSADLERIAAAHDEVLAQIWGRNLLDLARPDLEEVRQIGERFKDILFEFPFQIPQNFIYLGRALGILSGISAQLDPQINPWTYIETFGQRLARGRALQQFGWNSARELLREYGRLPGQIKRLVDAAERGQLKLQFKPDAATQQQLDRLERRAQQLNVNVLTAATLLTGALLYLNGDNLPALAFWGVSAALALWGAWRGR